MLVSVIVRVTGGGEISTFFFSFFFFWEFFIVRVMRYTFGNWFAICDFGLRREDLARSADLGLIVIAADRCSLSTWESS